jgi:cellulose synthase/poly-beta-1,6-N-acetylglucosamine synthase-like glycosyltransferase
MMAMGVTAVAGLLPGSAEWLVATLALYGALVAGLHAWRLLRSLFRPGCYAAVNLLVLVRNQEHQVEGLVRSLAGLLRQREAAGKAEVVVVDCGSRDETPLIMERLCRQTGGVRFVRVRECAGGQSPCEHGLLACQSRVVLLVDARGAVDVLPVLQTARGLLAPLQHGKKRKCGS